MIKVIDVARISSESKTYAHSVNIQDIIGPATWKQRQQDKTTPTSQFLRSCSIAINGRIFECTVAAWVAPAYIRHAA
jgi:hypothetical protein